MRRGNKPSLDPERVRLARQLAAEMRAAGARPKWHQIAARVKARSARTVRAACLGQSYRWVS